MLLLTFYLKNLGVANLENFHHLVFLISALLNHAYHCIPPVHIG